MAANPQIDNKNLLNPGEIVFVPVRDQRTIDTRKQVAEAEAADQSVADLEAIQRNPHATPGERKMAAMELPETRNYANQQWSEVQKSLEAELRQAGAGAGLPDVATQPLLPQMRGRAPE